MGREEPDRRQGHGSVRRLKVSVKRRGRGEGSGVELKPPRVDGVGKTLQRVLWRVREDPERRMRQRRAAQKRLKSLTPERQADLRGKRRPGDGESLRNLGLHEV